MRKYVIPTLLLGICLVLPALTLSVTGEEPGTRATSIDVKLGSIPTIDGTISPGEWSDAQSISVTQTSTSPWTIYYKHSTTSLYIGYSFANNLLAEVYLDINNNGGTAPQTDDFKLHSSAANYETPGTGTGWATTQNSPNGWTAEKRGFYNSKEFNISYAKLGITPGETKTIGIMFYIMASPAADDPAWPSGAVRTDPSTWGTMSSSDYWSEGVPLNHPPLLENGMVDPVSGFTDEEFTYAVEYTDEDDDAPTVAQVVIDGTPHDMTTGDTTYTDGSLFTYNTYLNDDPHEFHFLFNDGKEEVRYPETGEIEGPTVITPNTPPELTEIPNGTFSIEEDSGQGNDLIDLEEYFSDDRNDGSLLFEITYQESPSKLLASIDGNYLDIEQRSENWFGTLQFRVKAADLGLDGTVSGDDLWTESNTFTIEVTPVNDDPVIKRVGTFVTIDEDNVVFEGDKAAHEDEWFNFTVEVEDADILSGWTEELSISVGASGPTVEKDEENGNYLHLSFLPTWEDVGWKNFDLTVEDSHGGSDVVSISIEVINVNDAPVLDFFVKEGKALAPDNGTILLEGESGAKEGQWFNFSMSAVDEDENNVPDGVLTFYTNSTLENLEVDPALGEVSFLPAAKDIGTVSFFIIVKDEEGAADSVRISLEVLNRNDPPVILNIDSETSSFVFDEGDYVNLTCEVDDPDMSLDIGEELSISWVSNIDGEIGTDLVLSRNDLSVGSHTVEVTVTDGEGLTSSESITVIIAEVKDIPEPGDPNGTAPEKKVEKEGAPVGIIIVIILVVIALLAGAGLLALTFLRKKEEKVEPPVESPPENTIGTGPLP
ncbi:MAG: hypothetical protein ACMUHM_06605 [Thermoplasmatota archaeon]